MKLSRLTLAALCCALLVLTGCPAEVWIPIEVAPRPRVASEHVQYLDTEPSRPYTVVGIITPPAGEYDTEASAVHAMRDEAARHGADAIFIETKTESNGWRFSVGFGGSGGSFKDISYRAKAIVWK